MISKLKGLRFNDSVEKHEFMNIINRRDKLFETLGEGNCNNEHGFEYEDTSPFDRFVEDNYHYVLNFYNRVTINRQINLIFVSALTISIGLGVGVLAQLAAF
jgi:hypothetical protein